MKKIFLILLLTFSITSFSQNYDTHFDRGLEYFHNKKYNIALSEFELAYSFNNSSYDVYHNICLALYEIGDNEKALKKINKGLKKFPKKSGLYHVKAEILFNKKEYKKSIKILSEAINIDSSNINLYDLRAKAYYNLNKLEQGLKDLKTVYYIDNYSLESHNSILGFCYESKNIEGLINQNAEHYKYNEKNKNYSIYSNYTICEEGQLATLITEGKLKSYEKEAGINLFKQIYFGSFSENDFFSNQLRLLTNEHNQSAFLFRVYLYHLVITKSIESNLGILYHTIELNPNIYNILLEKAQLQYNQTEYDDCLLTTNKALSLNEKYSPAYTLRAEIEVRRKQFDKAILDYSSAIKLTPNLSINHLSKGETLRKMKKFSSAIQNFKNAIKIDSIHYWAFYGLGDCYLNIEEYDSSLYYLDVAFSINPRNVKIIQKIGENHIKTKEYEKAIRDFTRAIDISSGVPIYYGLRGRSYFLNKDYSKALNDFKYLNDIKETSFLCYQIAKCYYKVDYNDNNAIKYFERAIQLSPNKIDSYISLGWVYYLKNDYKKSLSYSNKAIVIDKKNTTAGYNIALATLCLNKVNESKEIYKKYAKINLEDKNKINPGAIKDLINLQEGSLLKDDIKDILNNILKYTN